MQRVLQRRLFGKLRDYSLRHEIKLSRLEPNREILVLAFRVVAEEADKEVLRTDLVNHR